MGGWGGGVGVIKRFFLYTTAWQVPIFDWRFDSAGVSFRVADLARSVIYIFLTLKDITKHFWRVNSGHNLMTYFDPLPVSNGAPHASIIIVSPLSVVELHT